MESYVGFVMNNECNTTYMLDSDEVSVDERDVVNLTESTGNTRMVNLRNENGYEVCQEGWLFLEIEHQWIIVTTANVSTVIHVSL